MNQLILLRGLPGSGKTTLANFLSNALNNYLAWENAKAISADDFWVDPITGEYKFDLARLYEAHMWCQEQTRLAMEQDVTHVIVHNTSSVAKELAPYLDLAERFNYRVISLVVENRHGNKDIHNVPEETLAKMKNRFTVQLLPEEAK